MKTAFQILLGCLLAVSANAEFRVWTRNDGKSAELDLIAVTGADGDKSGEFKMRNGKSVTLKASVFAEADAKLLAEWTPAPVAAAPAVSVFDAFLDGDLVRLSGKSLKSCKDATKPKKYYLLYYTASWCGPCQKFTPSLVDYYNKHKPGNDDFELILVTSDSDEAAMEEYAQQKQMPWPQLKLSRVERFKKEFKHPGRGIPNLVLTDIEGKLIKTSYEGENYVGPAVVMNHLATLLEK
jgi:nucleoredoxin